jgi:serine/threonine protein kinase
VKGYSADHKPTNDFGVIFRDGESEGVTVEIPDVQIDGVIGSGANGIVFSGTDSLDREVVIKVYPPRSDRDEDIYEVQEQAMAEAQKIANLKHGSIATLYRFGRLDSEYGSLRWWPDDRWPYLVMEYCSGQPLKEVIEDMKEDLMARRSALHQIFDALSHAEEHGSLHGDLHGGNILINWYPRFGINEVAVIDFGTSMFAGKESSAARHARLLRRMTFTLLPEMETAFVLTSRLLRRVGRDMLPRLVAALNLYDYMNPSPQYPVTLTPRYVGANLAMAADFNLDTLWTALRPHLDGPEVAAVKTGLLEFLTHEQELAEAQLADEEVANRLQQVLESQDIEAAAILS